MSLTWRPKVQGGAGVHKLRHAMLFMDVFNRWSHLVGLTTDSGLKRVRAISTLKRMKAVNDLSNFDPKLSRARKKPSHTSSLNWFAHQRKASDGEPFTCPATFHTCWTISDPVVSVLVEASGNATAKKRKSVQQASELEPEFYTHNSTGSTVCTH